MSAAQDEEYLQLVYMKMGAIKDDPTMDANRRFAAHLNAIISSHAAVYGATETAKKFAAVKLPT